LKVFAAKSIKDWRRCHVLERFAVCCGQPQYILRGERAKVSAIKKKGDEGVASELLDKQLLCLCSAENVCLISEAIFFQMRLLAANITLAKMQKRRLVLQL